MATATARLCHLSPSQPPLTSSQQLYAFRLPRRLQPISCGGGGIDRNRRNKKQIVNAEADLSSALSMEARKLQALAVEREEAMKKSRQLLFSELCGFAGVSPLDMKIRWTNKMHQADKLVLLTEFVSEWGTNFHPLSARSAGELIEQHLAVAAAAADEEDLDSSGHDHAPFTSSPPSSHFHSRLFSGWRNLFNV